MKRFSLKKAERLSSQKIIGELVASGKSFMVHPFRVYYTLQKEAGVAPAQIAISVSKKRFKKATTRNTIKRRIKESYRKNKSLLKTPASQGFCFLILLVYISDNVLPYSLIEEKIVELLQKLVSPYEKSF